jgi:beta-mannosidase
MAKQIRELFGFIPDNFEDFALASQISQAEAKKHFIELFRGKKWRKTGIVWPQFSDAVVDYYFTKKLAYSYIKTAQQPVLVMMGTPSSWNLPIIISNNSPDAVTVDYRVIDLKTDKELKHWHATVNGNTSATVDGMAYSKSEKTVYLIEWTIGDKTYKNHYLCGEPTFDFGEYVALIKKAGLFETEGF